MSGEQMREGLNEDERQGKEGKNGEKKKTERVNQSRFFLFLFCFSDPPPFCQVAIKSYS